MDGSEVSRGVVDVVIVTFNSAADLPACLDALPAVASLTIVDNASSDSTGDVAAARGDRVLRNDRNVGFGVAANQGARCGRSPYILFLNPDAQLRPGALDALVAACDRPGVAVAGAQLVSDQGEPLRSWWPIPSALNTWREALGLGRRMFPLVSADTATVPSVVGAAMLTRRDVFERLGGFDPQFWLYGEETDLCARCWDAGWAVVLAPSAVAVHPGGASGRTIHPVVFEHFCLAGELIIERRQGRWPLLAHRVGVLVGAVAHLAANLVRRTGTRADNRRWRRVAQRQLGLLWRSPTRADPSRGQRLRRELADA